MEIFHRVGLAGAFRISHVIVAVMWMGLLWYFNFVQTPAYAEMEASSRNDAFDKLTWRALWWFRWSAAATVVFGLLIIGIAPKGTYGKDFWVHTAAGPTLAIGILFGLAMFLNVWLVIWPNQQIVIANARTLKAGGEANPAAAAAARAGAMASRQNTIFSLPLLVFMVGASHFYNLGPSFGSLISSSKSIIYLIIGIVVLAVLELNALGKISGRGNTGLNVVYETHKNAMYTGIALIVAFYVLAEIILKA
ncbi:MAG TPA: urate hydroxylase PuuD [Acidimicrobiia bacterium]|jgi:uncharacterized membrane protein|nr:urate hydroxylase PuuD [Acidimicrobiia bacterium]